MIAVSNGPTVTSGASFTFFEFQQDQFAGGVDTGFFADFPSLGVDNNALYIGVNIFDTSVPGWALRGSTAFVINKADLLAGNLTVTPFRRIGSNLGGIFSPQGVTVLDSSVSSGFFIGTDALNSATLKIRRILTPGGIPALDTAFSLTVPSTGQPLPVVAQGTNPSLPLDAIGDRLMNAEIINGSLWTTHSIRVNSSGVGTSGGDRNAMRFYEINNLESIPTLRQSGTLYDTAASNPLHYWVGSIATSGQGHTALASSYGGNTAFAGVAFDGRLSGDVLGSLNPTINRTLGAAAYNLQTSCSPNCFQRWGDYSNTVVDPSDNMTMWSFQEYASAADVWGVLVTQLKAPPPATLLSATPSSAPAGTTLNVTIDGTSTSGSGFYDPGPGFLNRMSATVSGTGVTVNTVSYTSPTRITLGLTVDPAAATGSRTITVTNPDGQAMAGSGLFSITASGITLSPVTLPDGAPTVSYSQNVTATGGTGPYTFSVLSGSLPTGLVLSPTGALTGVPTISGTATFTLKALDTKSNSGTRLYTMRIQTMLTSNVSLAITGKGYDSTAAPIYPGGQWTLNTTLTNNGSPITTPLFFKLVQLAKSVPDLDPAHPDRLTSADNGGGVAGDNQNIGVSSLASGKSTPVSFRVGLGSRQPFALYVDLYTVLSGSADTASDAASFKARLFRTAEAADPAPGVPVLIGRYQLDPLVAIPSPPPVSDFTSDLLSNVGVITGPGPQSGPAVAVDPIVSTRIAVASNDYVAGTVRVSTSTDGGKTWHSTTLSRTVNNQDFYTAQNPSLGFDSSGKLSVVYTLANLNDSANAVVISESSDGIHFNPPSALTFHLASDRIIDNRPVIAIKSGAGRYVAWDTFSTATLQYSINLVRSEEGGVFGPVTNVVSNALVSSPALALSKNIVYVGWDEWGFNSIPPYNTGGRLMIASSPAGSKLNFGAAQEIAQTGIGFAQTITAMPEKGVGPNLALVGDPKNDRIYAAFTDRTNGMRIRFARSGNRGRTWQAMTVSDNPNPSDQFSPAIAVDSDGNIKISYYDTTLSSTAEAVHVFLARSNSNKGDLFDTERISTMSSNDSRSNPLRDYTANLGDRTAAAMIDGDVLVAWTDTRLDSEDVFLSVVFDPDGESVTGTGKILSPAGAFPAYPTLTGKAEFGFGARYRKHSSVPLGDTEFTFVADKFKFKFKSTSYDQFVVAGATAQLKGSGKINGEGGYTFLLTIIDGNQPGGGGVGRFRIKIMNSATGVLIYDNAPGATASPQAITEGRIKIQNN